MNPLDDLFREGLGDRKAEVPADLWQKIAARKGEVPAGEALDRLFADKLARRQAPVPVGMWDRIAAARRRAPWGGYAAAGLLLLVGVLTVLLWAGPQVPGDNPVAGLTGAATTFPLPTPATPIATGASPIASEPANPLPAPRMTTTGGRATGAGVVPSPTTPAATLLATDRSNAPPPAAWTDAEVATAVRRTAGDVPPLPGDTYDPVVAMGTALPKLTPVVTTPSFRRSGDRRLRGEVLLGAAYAHQRFTLQEGGDRAIRDAREVSEFPELSYQFSARLQYPVGRRWTLLTGLTYAEIRNQLEYDLPRNGTMTLIRSNNHLRLLEVPVLAGYTVSRGRLRLSLNAGPVLNLFAHVRGQYLDPGQATPLDLAGSRQYRSNVGLGWTTSLTTTYGLGAGRATRLLLEPFFKSYPRSFTRPDAPLAEHYWMAGLQIGLRRAF